MVNHNQIENQTRFVSIDVETANPDMGSICQIGTVKFVDGQIEDEWSSLIDPEDYFDDVNVSIHGINSDMVCGKPTLPQIANQLRNTLENNICVCHTHFDRIAINRSFNRYNLDTLSTTWLDSARVVRRTWKDLAWRGYGLSNVCAKIGYQFHHHNALEDARAAGFVLLAAINISQINLESWLHRVNLPIDTERSSCGAAIHRVGNPDGDLFGEVIVFTGSLEVTRSEAADLAASVGCEVAQNVTRKTTLLVVGDQDITKLAGHSKSSKHRKAEQLIAEGFHIRIIRETDFKALVHSSTF